MPGDKEEEEGEQLELIEHVLTPVSTCENDDKVWEAAEVDADTCKSSSITQRFAFMLSVGMLCVTALTLATSLTTTTSAAAAGGQSGRLIGVSDDRIQYLGRFGHDSVIFKL